MYIEFGIITSIILTFVSLAFIYFIIKVAVKNAIKEAYEEITGKETYGNKQEKK